MSYKTVIGLEIHVQLKTKSKMFCGCDNSAENATPNSLVCPVCMGLPGVLPVANYQAIEWAVKTGLALNAKIAKVSKFDRKHYFYPDLPKNYQISQYDAPFCSGGFLEIPARIATQSVVGGETADGIKKINLIRIHLEEDAGKLIHTPEATLVDFNRAGTPLMEIVSEPEISSPAEAKFFMQELRSILRYLDVSDADMEKGHLRCDANISIAEINDSHPERSEGSPANAGTGTSPEILRSAQNDKFQMGIPVEIKNMNSFKMVERALTYEEKRQKELIDRGEKIPKETRGWNDAKGETYLQRSKEFAQDYRYFPEPDIPSFKMQEFDLAKIKKEIPELPAAKSYRYREEFGLNLPDADILVLEPAMAEYFEKIAKVANPKLAANWIINELKMDGIIVIAPDKLIGMLKMIEAGVISGKMAKEVLAEMITTGKGANEIIKEKGLGQISDEIEITKIIDEVLKENSKPFEDFKNGKKEALGFLVGQVMSKTQGKANPQLVNKLLVGRTK